jgi:hypothetical protein
MSEGKEEASHDVKTVEDVLNLPSNSQLKFGLLIGLIEVGQVADKDVVDTVLNLVSLISVSVWSSCDSFIDILSFIA